MFRIFWTSVFCSFLATAWSAGQEAVVIRLAKAGTVEAVFTATSFEQKGGEIRLTDPRLYLPNPEQEEGFGASPMGSWPAYTTEHPGEVALWRAASCVLKVNTDITKGGLDLDAITEMVWSGDAVMELGYGKRRSIFRARELRLVDQKIEIPGPFAWNGENWSISGSKAKGFLAPDAKGRPLRLVSNLVLEGSTEARGLVSLPGLGQSEFTLKSEGSVLASVTDDKVGFRGQGPVEGWEPKFRVHGNDPRGLLGPTGWHYLELENPRAHYEGPDTPGGVELKGRYMYMEPRQVEISGNPVTMKGSKVELESAGVRWDRGEGRIHCDDPKIKTRKPAVKTP
ncbi:MAG: hypothetical protein AB7F75_04780 [Planctomycetota bacterium]